MATSAIGFYFDRFRVLVGGQDFAQAPGNILSLAVSQDGGLTWVDGFSPNHMPQGVLRANTHTVFRITENLQYNVIPIDFSAIDYSASSVDIQLIAPNSQYAADVYAGGSVYLLKSVAWAADSLGAQYAVNVRRDLDFFVVGGSYWLTV
jgi:hypothetical protein